MTQIKSMVFCSRAKLKNIFESSGFEVIKSDFTPLGLDFINYILPLKLKFLNESYVALENNKAQALLTLEKHEKHKKRFKITRLFLEKNSFDTGKLLVDYVTSRYCAQGANSYQVIVEDSMVDMINLFKEGCGFKKVAQEFIYKIENENIDTTKELVTGGFEPFKYQRAQEVSDLYNENINSFQRHNFSREKEQFKLEFATGIKNKASFSYLLENEKTNQIYGYFNIQTYNNHDYILDFVLNRGFEEYYENAISFITNCINRRTKKWNLYIKLKSYFNNFEIFKEYLEKNNYSFVKSSQILVKDYLKEVKEESFLNSAKIVFSDINVAYKTNKSSL